MSSQGAPSLQEEKSDTDVKKCNSGCIYKQVYWCMFVHPNLPGTGLNFTVWMNLLQMTFLSPLPNKRRKSILKTIFIDKLTQIMLGEGEKKQMCSYHSIGALKGGIRGSLSSFGTITKRLHRPGLPRISQGLLVDLDWFLQGQGHRTHGAGKGREAKTDSAFCAPAWLPILSILPPQWGISSCLPLLFQDTPFSQSLPLPIFSNLVYIDDVVSLSYGNFSGIRRKSHALHHIALSAILRVKKRSKK